MKRNTSLYMIMTILSFSLFLQNASAGNLELSIDTEERCYVGEGGMVTIYCNLTSNGSPVSNGLVSIQTIDPKGDTYVMRTITTGPPPPSSHIEIVEVMACDKDGNPRSNFTRGEKAGFQLTVKNTGGSAYEVSAPLAILFSDGIPFMTFVIYNSTLGPDTNETVRIWPFPIPGNAPLGVTTIYASALNRKWPVNGGLPWCPEKTTSFEIIREGKGSHGAHSTAVSGDFNISFRISDQGGQLGTYEIYATSHLNFLEYAGDQEAFEAVLVADITGSGGNPDGKVNMMDIYKIIQGFGSIPGDPNWNPIADIAPVGNTDNKINMKDIYKAIKDFGKEGQL